MVMSKKNYRSDFSLWLNVFDGYGQWNIPEYGVRVRLRSESGGKVFRAYWNAEEPEKSVNIRLREGRLLVVCNRHGLMPGRVFVEIDMAIPNALYADGYDNRHYCSLSDIELVTGNSDDDYPGEVDFEVLKDGPVELPEPDKPTEPTEPDKPDEGCGCGCGCDEVATEQDIEDIASAIFDAD